MTFEGYEDLATETLEENTQKAIKASLPYEPAGVEVSLRQQHRLPSKTLCRMESGLSKGNVVTDAELLLLLCVSFAAALPPQSVGPHLR
jgi:hypothetical protein